LHAAIPSGKSLEKLRRCAETQIDPQAVNALAGATDEPQRVRAIRDGGWATSAAARLTGSLVRWASSARWCCSAVVCGLRGPGSILPWQP